MPGNTSAFRSISAVDYTVVLVRDWPAMRRFYEEVLGFAPTRELSPTWIEYGIGPTMLALARPKRIADDLPTPAGSASLQLAFRVPVADVDRCAAELVGQGIALVSPPSDQPFGHRTLFFRDPDGNLLEIYAEIAGADPAREHPSASPVLRPDPAAGAAGRSLPMSSAIAEHTSHIFSGEPNLSMTERALSVAGGLTLAAIAAKPRPNMVLSLVVLAAGVALALRGASGHCAAKAMMGSHELDA